MKLNKKAAIEMSMNFLIGIILGIAMLSFGIYFLTKIVPNDDWEETFFPDYYEEEAKACVSRGDPVCIIEKRQVIRVKKYGSFGLVINNMLGREAEFKPVVTFSLGITDDDEEIEEEEGIWTHEQERAIELENNEYELVSLDFTVPAGTDPGDYIFNVYVCYDSNENPSEFCPLGYKSLYGAPNQITISVP